MSGEPLAEATVRVRPDVDSFKEELLAGVEAAGAGVGEEGAKQGVDYGGKFARETKRRLELAFRDLPDAKVTADSTDAELKLAAIRAELVALHSEHIGVTIDGGLFTAQVARMKAELASIGNDGTVSKSIRTDAAAAAKDLESDLFKAAETGLTDGSKAGGKSGVRSFMSSFAESFSGIGDALIPGLIATAILLSPLIGAAINSVLLAGVGLGGLGLGIAGQIHSPEVHAAITDVANLLLNTTRGATAPFVEPLAGAVKTLGGALADLIDGIDFSKLSTALIPLADGLAEMIDKVGPGLNEALSESVPLLEDFASWLPAVGSAISDMFHEMAGSTAGAKEGLRTLMLVLIGGIEILGILIGTLSNAWAAIVAFGDGLSNTAQKLFGWIPGINSLNSGIHEFFDTVRNGGDNVVVLGRNLHDTGNDAGFVTDAVREMSNEFDAAFGKVMSLDTANLQYKTDLLALKDAVKQHGASMDINTQAGQENRRMLLGLIQDAENTRQAMIDQAGGANASQAAIDAANQQYQTTIDSLDTFATSVHMSKDELDKLKGQYNIDLLYTTTYVERGTPPTALDYSSIPTGRIGGRAAGGPTEANTMYWVGEEGPELWMADLPGTIIPNHELGALANAHTSAALTPPGSPPARGGSGSGAPGVLYADITIPIGTDVIRRQVTVTLKEKPVEVALATRAGEKKLRYT